jgi:hypothetical protein
MLTTQNAQYASDMAHTPEMRDQNALCGAKKKNGEKCRAFAGQGTQHPGIGACSFHLGRTPSANKAAIKREVAQHMVQDTTLGEPIETDAKSALLSELYASTGHVAWLKQQLADLSKDELATPYGQAVVQLYNSERSRKSHVAELCIKGGLDEAAIHVLESQLTLLGTALAKACDTAGLSEPMRRRLGAALREELGALEAAPRALTA